MRDMKTVTDIKKELRLYQWDMVIRNTEFDTIHTPSGHTPLEKVEIDSIDIPTYIDETPLDMMDMSFGIADPTGSCVWLGAFLFMEIFARKLDVDTSYEQRYWSSIRSKIFPKGCHAVELGSGTGMAGL